MRTVQQILFFLSLTFLFTQCIEKEVITTGSISGRVVNGNTGAGLRNITVTLNDETKINTGNSSSFYFSNLESGRYTMEFSGQGYETISYWVTVTGKEVEVECEMYPSSGTTNPGGDGGDDSGGDDGGGDNGEEPGDEPSPAKTTFADRIQMSDALYYYFSPSSDTYYYYWTHFRADEVPATDEAIIAAILEDGVRMNPAEGDEGYSWDLEESSEYLVCTLSFDRDGKQGQLYKEYHATRYSRNQPEALLEIQSKAQEAILMNVTMNAHCESYVMTGWLNLTEEQANLPDIVWASVCYEYGKAGEEIYTTDYSNFLWEGWSRRDYNIVITLGYDRNNNYGAVINKEVFTFENERMDNSSLSGQLQTRGTLLPKKDKVTSVQKVARHRLSRGVSY